MKRSEMLKVLNCALVKSGLLKIFYGDSEDLDYVLTKLEEAGMKPPLTKRCPVLLTISHVWEPEDKEITNGL